MTTVPPGFVYDPSASDLIKLYKEIAAGASLDFVRHEDVCSHHPTPLFGTTNQNNDIKKVHITVSPLSADKRITKNYIWRKDGPLVVVHDDKAPTVEEAIGTYQQYVLVEFKEKSFWILREYIASGAEYEGLKFAVYEVCWESPGYMEAQKLIREARQALVEASKPVVLDSYWKMVFEKMKETDGDEQDGDTLCGECGEENKDSFWICCETCETWFHGTCVQITPAMAAEIQEYQCPSCSVHVSPEKKTFSEDSDSSPLVFRRRHVLEDSTVAADLDYSSGLNVRKRLVKKNIAEPELGREAESAEHMTPGVNAEADRMSHGDTLSPMSLADTLSSGDRMSCGDGLICEDEMSPRDETFYGDKMVSAGTLTIPEPNKEMAGEILGHHFGAHGEIAARFKSAVGSQKATSNSTSLNTRKLDDETENLTTTKSKAESSSTSLNTRKLDDETENLTHEKVPSELKRAIMQGRTDKKLTQAQVAQMINEKPEIIEYYESGKAIPSLEIILKLERALGVKLHATKSKAASSSTSLNTGKLDDETENLTHEKVPSELKNLTQAQFAQLAQLAQMIKENPQIIQEYESGKPNE